MKERATILVTGATGFIGSRLVQFLAEQGHHVRALSRRDRPESPVAVDDRPSPWRMSNVDLVKGDILDRDSLAQAMRGCDYVFHLAGYAKNWSRNPSIYYDINVKGTENVFQLAFDYHVKRVVWTSSIVTFGPTPPGVVADETLPRITDHCYTEYERSKIQAERLAVPYLAKGLPLVIVNPTRVYGPGLFTEGNALAKLIDDYDRGRMPFLFNRGINVGNYAMVDDVARGHILAMKHGRIGEKYILGGENASLSELLQSVDRVSGRRHFQIPLLKYGPLVFAWILQKRAELFGIYPPVTPGWVQTFSVDWVYSCDKARNELGYEPTPLQTGIEKTYRWLLEIRRREEEAARLRRAIRRGRSRSRRFALGLFAARGLKRR